MVGNPLGFLVQVPHGLAPAIGRGNSAMCRYAAETVEGMGR